MKTPKQFINLDNEELDNQNAKKGKENKEIILYLEPEKIQKLKKCAASLQLATSSLVLSVILDNLQKKEPFPKILAFQPLSAKRAKKTIKISMTMEIFNNMKTRAEEIGLRMPEYYRIILNNFLDKIK